jgi:transcription initiation factor TFIIIB Brf1 subunit/transcription initiation factor TFIIB
MEDPEVEESAPIEKPKKKLSEKQLANLQNGRDRLRKKVELTVEQKAQKKLEDRFDKLVAMFEQVKLPTPEVREKVKAKRAVAQKVESEDDEEEVVLEKPRSIKKPVPARQVLFSFK